MKKYKDLTKYEREVIEIPVCNKCLLCACNDRFQLYICKDAWNFKTNIWKVPLYYLEQYRKESPDFWQPHIDYYFEEKENMQRLVEASIDYR